MTSTLDRLRATLAALMQVTGESHEDLGRALRVSQATVSRKQGRQSRWNLDDCDGLAQHYGISVTDLLSSTDNALNSFERNRRGPDGTHV